MDGIPPARDTDAEDVVWALQTAEALWKRSERGDAIVWLRRAAQAAGEANDDDRALLLAREAAELTEWLARASSAALNTLPPVTEGSVGGVDIDTLLRSSHVDSSEIVPVSIPQQVAPVATAPPPVSPPAADVPLQPEASEQGPGLSPSIRVPTAAESHAGMLDPWSDTPESEAKKGAHDGGVEIKLARGPAAPAFDEEVVTSARPVAPVVAQKKAGPATDGSAPVPKVQKPPPPRPKSQQLGAVQAKAAVEPPRKLPAAPPTPAVSEAALSPPSPPSDAPLAPLDLSAVDAFADLPDDSRAGLAQASTLRRYAKGDAVESFGLVYVLSGEVHVLASAAPSPAVTIGKGTVLRARGTLDDAIALRLVCASAKGVVATWDDQAVETALGACPWVEEELRSSGDRVQAFAGATLGALGQRLSPELRTVILEKMTMRALAEHETIVTEGVPVPGILLVAAGKVDLIANHDVTAQITAGQFVLPAEALSAGPSPATARAAEGGAIVFAADRKTSQELFATEPLLLELLAGW
jgi:hypothetical protein